MRYFWFFFLFGFLAKADFQVPELKAPVNDYAHILASDFETDWNRRLKAVYEKEKIQIAILSVETLNGLTIEEASIAVADKWRLGDKETDKGLLILLAKKERKIRIEVGQGLEGDLPDARAKQIIADIMLPQFRKGRFDAGFYYGLEAIFKNLEMDTSAFGKIKHMGRKKSRKQDFISLIFTLLFLFFISRTRAGRRAILLGSVGGYGHRGGYHDSSSSSGGFGGFSGGGGGFSGGGASGSW